MLKLKVNTHLPNNNIKKQNNSIDLKYTKKRVLGVLQDCAIISPDILEILLDRNYILGRTKMINSYGDSNNNFFLELKAWESNGKAKVLKRKGVIDISISGNKNSGFSIFLQNNNTKQFVNENEHPILYKHIVDLIT